MTEKQKEDIARLYGEIFIMRKGVVAVSYQLHKCNKGLKKLAKGNKDIKLLQEADKALIMAFGYLGEAERKISNISFISGNLEQILRDVDNGNIEVEFPDDGIS